MASPRRVTVLFLIVAVSSSSAFTSPEPETTLACVQPSVAAEGGDVFLACGRGTSVLVGRGANGTVRGPLEPLGTLESLALGHHRGPRLAVSGSNVVVTAVGKREGANAVDVWAWHSTDSGHSWSGPVRVTDVPNAAQEGLQAVAVSGARVAVAWLDTRKGAMQSVRQPVVRRGRRRGRRTPRSTARPAARSARAATRRCSSARMGRSRRCSGTTWTETATCT